MRRRNVGFCIHYHSHNSLSPPFQIDTGDDSSGSATKRRIARAAKAGSFLSSFIVANPFRKRPWSSSVRS